MNTLRKEYVTKFSSGLTLALLAFSGLLVLIPVATPVFASNASLPTVTVTSGNPVLGGSSNTIGLKVANPSSNQFTVTGFVINVPSGWTITASTAGAFLPSHTFSASAASWTVSVFEVGTGAGIPPGGSDSFTFTATAATGTYPLTGTFTSKVQDASAVSFYNGPSFSIMVIDPSTTVSVTPTTSANYAAGSAPLTETATVTPHQAGLSIVFSAPGYGPSTTYSFSPATATTNSNGVATTTFQPSNHAGDATTVTATIGTSTISATSAGTITTVNGPPTQVALTFTAGNSNHGVNYLNVAGTTANNNVASFTGALMASGQLSAALTDAFGNAVNFASFTGGSDTWTITLTATSSSGIFDAYSSATNHPSVIKCTEGGNWQDGSGLALTPTVACPSGATNSFALPFNYFQGSDYGTTGVMTSAASGVYLGNAFISTLATSGNIFTTVFFGASFPNFASPTSVKAGGTTNVWEALGPASPMTKPQKNVPVALYLDNATSYETTSGAMDYGANSLLPAAFSNGMDVITGATNSTGFFLAKFTVDTVAGAHAFFYANITFPVNTGVNPTGYSVNIQTDTSPAVITTAGSPSKFSFYVTYDAAATNPVKNGGKAVFSAALYVDVYISDNYNNLATNPGPGQIQITLAPSGGVLSATNIYIPAQCADTSGHFSVSPCSPFGVVVWTLPSSAASLTLSATGVLAGVSKSATFSVSTVSKTPSITVQTPTPVSGVLYSDSNGVLFSGVANASAGYPKSGAGSVTIASVTFSADNGAAVSATLTTSGHDVAWQASVFFTSVGMHNITFTATDSAGNSVSSGSFKVLIDTAAPTVKFITKNNANLTYGSSVTAQVTDLLGDLAYVNATIDGKQVTETLSGTNNPGTSVTYTVTIANLAAGNHTIGLTATDLAGNTGTATSITVHVTVPFAQSIVINSATYGTLGSFSGISVSATNVWSSSQSLVVFAVWKNSAGQTVAVTTGGLTLASGATGTAFAPLAGALPSGTYSVSVFVVTTSNNPVSASTTISVAV